MPFFSASVGLCAGAVKPGGGVLRVVSGWAVLVTMGCTVLASVTTIMADNLYALCGHTE